MNDSLHYQYGIGAFETLRFEDGKPLRIERHLDRLAKALKVLDLEEVSRQVCRDRILGAIDVSGQSSGIVKLIVSDQGLSTHLRDNPYRKRPQNKGFRLMVSDVELPRASRYTIKSTNYLVNHLEWQRARTEGFDDALFLNGQGHIVETTRSNLFAVIGGRIVTPECACGCLSGIMRGVIIEESDDPIEQTRFDLQELLGAEAVFLTNAVMGVMPVEAIGDTKFESVGHPAIIKRMNQYR